MVKVILTLLFSLILTSVALAGTVTIAWDFTHDGVNNITRFKLNINRNCSTTTATVAVPVAQTTGSFTQQYTTTTLSPNTIYCIDVLALTEAGIESRTTNLIQFQTH